jgi:hypothetical protein
MENRPVRIANCSGFYGDRLAALAEMVADGPIDIVTGDYLAEVTMLILARSRLKNPDGGYATTFLRQLEPVAGEIADRGIKVVVNAGGLNPAGLATATREMLERIGVDLTVAYVEGDDLVARIPALLADGYDLAHLDTGAPFTTWGRNPLTANAYLGGFGIKAALAAGADIVVTGRVADASLVSGAAAWWWDWSPADIDALAGAVAAGHVIECGAQATGGNFSGFRGIDLVHPGFPLAEVDRDGCSIITKHAGTGGAVTVDTVTAQLLYEVGEPAYLNPDVITLLDTVRLEQAAADRVRISGVRGGKPPPTTKVAITGFGGFRNSSTVVLTGIDVDAKSAAFESAVRAGLGGNPGITELRFTRIGLAADDPADQMAGSCLLEISVDGDEKSCGRAFSSLLIELALANYPGIYYTAAPGNGRPFGAYWPAIVPQAIVEHTVVHADGRREIIPPPPTAVHIPSSAGVTSDPGPDFGPAVEQPLGRLVNARSGDKGGNANVGLWVGDDDAWPWLASTMTTERMRALLPEAAELPIDRYELPNLRAVNFVIRGLLDGGAVEARRFDKQAKALGEWIRARHVAIPEKLIRGAPG